MSPRPNIAERLLRATPLRYRVGLVIFIAGSLIVILAVQQTLSRAQGQLIELAQENRSTILEIVGVRSVPALLTSEYRQLDAALASLAQGPAFVQLDVLDVDGEIVASSDFDRVGTRDAGALKFEPSTIIEEIEVIGESGRLGTVRIHFDNQMTLQALADARRRGLLVGGAAVAMLALLGILGGWAYSKRLRLLRAHINDVDDDDVPLPISITGHDEVAQVATALNQRTETIRENLRADAQTREALLLSDARLKLALSAAADAVIEVDLSNGEFEILGSGAVGAREMEAMRGSVLEWWDLIHPDDLESARSAVNDHIGEPDALLDLEARFRSKSGGWRTLQIRGQAVPSTTGSPDKLLLGILDVTMARIYEHQLFHADKMRSLGELTSAIAHDFNNMLTVSTLIVSTLQDPHRDKADDIIRFDQLAKANDRAAALIGRLLLTGRVEEAATSIVDINRMVEDVVETIAPLLGSDVHFELHLGAPLATVRMEEARAQQLVINLAQNAADAMSRAGAITIATQAIGGDDSEPGVALPTPYLKLTIADTGPGIDPEVRASLFEPFVTTKETSAGTGLGLATSFETIMLAGGTIEALNDDVGGGACFVVRLPLVIDAARTATTPLPARPNQSPLRILLVDDKPDVLASAAELLRMFGHDVTEAGQPDEAIREARAMGVVDLVITDVGLPTMDGTELGRRITKLHPGVKILYMSGFVAIDIDPAVLNADNLLMKPFSGAELLDRVSKITESVSSSG